MARTKGSVNKSTQEIKSIFAECEAEGSIDWKKLFVALYKRGLKPGGDKSATLLVEYKFGKAPQPIVGDGENPIIIHVD